MCKTCGCKDAESFDAEEYLDGEKCVDCKTETIYIVKNTPKDLSYLMCFTCGSEHFSDKLYFAESFGAERVYDKYQVYVINPDGTEDLYGEYESYQDAEADIESDGELDYYIIEKKLSSSPIHKFGAESFGAKNNTKFELLGSKYIEGVGIVTEGSPYLKNYYGEMDEYNIYDDDAAEIIMSIPMNDARFPLKGGEIELIRAMVYGFEHPRINDSWGELNEDGMFWTTKVMETLANYDSSEAESFEAQGNPDKRTTTQYAKFYVGFEDDEGELRGGGKFKKYNDAVSQAKIVSKREGNSRVVSTRGFALWTDDGKGMFQEGYDKTVAKEFYSAEGYSIGSGFRLGFGLGLGMLALSTVTTIVALAASTIDERQVEK
jgi:hypothetical protein